MADSAHSGFADIALPVPLPGAFTYAVPAAMALEPGMRVRAPWGARALTGVVVALRQELPAGLQPHQVRELTEVLDAAALVDAPVLELVRWAAAYYQAPLGDLMRCALPPGDGRPLPPRRGFQLVEGAGGEGKRTTGAQQRVVELLGAAGGSMDAAELRHQVSASALATLVRHGRIAACPLPPQPPAPPLWEPRPRVVQLNTAQDAALAAIQEEGGRLPLLLHGVTGSGKTAVYLAAMEAALARGESALLLVPEIGLTPALFADFAAAFSGQVAILHSGLGERERAHHWQRLRSGAACVAIGTRSAVFAPLRRLGLIVVDEEHDASFKQQESPRYHGRDLAVLRAKLEGARIVLGSATPSLESYRHAREGKYRLVEMRERATPRPLPAIRIIDMGAEFRSRTAGPPAPRRPQQPQAQPAVAGGSAPAAFLWSAPPGRSGIGEVLLSEALRAALEERLGRGQQSLLLINRRGFAPVVLCRSCGASVQCRDCALALTYHKREGRLLCHLCGYSVPPPAHCPACGSEHIYFVGTGSEKVEETLAGLWPAARIARLDRDTARGRGHFEKTLARFRAGALDILVGTQMIAKGHDLPGVTLVGVLHADGGLTFPDFRAAERTFQLLTQVAGRAGRGEEPGEVILQVMHPGHYAVETAARGDFAGFYEKEANFRRWLHYPPFAALASAQFRHRDYDRVLAYATAAGQFLRGCAGQYPATRILGPSPAMLARAKAEYRFQFLFKSESRRELNALLGALRAFARVQKLPATALVLDVDPLSL